MLMFITVPAQLRLRVHNPVHECLHVLANERDFVTFLDQDIDRVSSFKMPISLLQVVSKMTTEFSFQVLPGVLGGSNRLVYCAYKF
jgi:hypothetical protein